MMACWLQAETPPLLGGVTGSRLSARTRKETTLMTEIIAWLILDLLVFYGLYRLFKLAGKHGGF